MAKRKFYDMDRATIVQVSQNLFSFWARHRPGQKTNWNAAQQADIAFLTDQVQVLLSVVSHLNEIVQNDGE
jgi:hypothetical protein